MEKIKNAVRALIRRCGTTAPEEICEKSGICVLDQELPAQVNGFTVRMEGIPFIVLNRSLDYDARRITMAHELGHIILHGAVNTLSLSVNTSFCVNRLEREADCFAALLLFEYEQNQLDGRESLTSEEFSKLTHMPKNMIDLAFFGE